MGWVEVLMGKPDGEEPLEYLDIDGRIVTQEALHKWDARFWTGFIWLRKSKSDVLLWRRQWTYMFQKVRWKWWLSQDLRTSQERISSIELMK